jgi:general secretion pathway protein N
MIRYGAILGLAAGLVSAGELWGQVSPAGAPRAMDASKSADPSTEAVPLAANPLWGIPLGSLAATRERPIFSPSRRPPPPPVLAAVNPTSAKPPPKAAEPDHPLLSPVGMIVGGAESIAVFVDQATNDVIRLRIGEGHDGWILRSVEGRKASFEKNRRTATLTLPPHGVPPGLPLLPTDQSAPAVQPAIPTAVGAGGSGSWRDGDGQMISPPPRPAGQVGGGASR